MGESDEQESGEDPREAKSLEWAMRVGRQRSSLLLYRIIRTLIRVVLFRWLRVEVRGAEHLETGMMYQFIVTGDS